MLSPKPILDTKILEHDNFKLDKRLESDCFILTERSAFIVLLMNNSSVPWFILVPKTDKTELHELETKMQNYCMEEINLLSKFISSEFKPDKINVAAIGNIVKQLHIHVIGRFENDPCWPGVVWGNKNLNNNKRKYSMEKVENISEQLKVFTRGNI